MNALKLRINKDWNIARSERMKKHYPFRQKIGTPVDGYGQKAG